MKITNRTDHLKARKTRWEIPDAIVPGMSVIVQPSGVKSYVVRFKLNDERRKMTLGRCEVLDLTEARNMARDALGKVVQGIDPTVRTTSADTVVDVVERFLAESRRNTRASSAREYAGIFRRYVLPAWGDRPVRSITRADVHKRLEDVVAYAPVMANRTLTLLRQLFAWCLERDLLEHSPTEGIKAKHREQPRDRVVDDEELVRLWNALDDIDPLFRGVVRLLVLTAARREEVLALRWSEVDLEAATITLARERSKNRIARTIPLSRAALAVLDALPRIEGTDFLFPSARTLDRPASGFSKWKDRLDERAKVADWTFHDFRRTAATGMQRLGIALPVVEEVLGHVSGSRSGIVGIYQRHRYEDEKRRALEAWGEHVRGLLEPDARSSKIIRLR